MILSLILALALPASAAEYKFTKRVDLDGLTAELRAAGLTVDYIACNGDACKIVMGPGDPSAVVAAHVYQDPAAKRAAMVAELAALEAKMGASMTAAEIRRAIRLTILLAGLK